MERRELIRKIVVNEMGFKLFFVESICDDPQIIEQNIMVSVERNKIQYYFNQIIILTVINLDRK